MQRARLSSRSGRKTRTIPWIRKAQDAWTQSSPPARECWHIPCNVKRMKARCFHFCAVILLGNSWHAAGQGTANGPAGAPAPGAPAQPPGGKGGNPNPPPGMNPQPPFDDQSQSAAGHESQPPASRSSERQHSSRSQSQHAGRSEPKYARCSGTECDRHAQRQYSGRSQPEYTGPTEFFRQHQRRRACHAVARQTVDQFFAVTLEQLYHSIKSRDPSSSRP